MKDCEEGVCARKGGESGGVEEILEVVWGGEVVFGYPLGKRRREWMEEGGGRKEGRWLGLRSLR